MSTKISENQYQDISQSLMQVAAALANLHDPCYVVGLHRSQGYLKLTEGLDNCARK